MKKQLSIFTSKYGADFVISALFSLGILELSIVDPTIIQEVLSSETLWDYIDDNLFENGETSTEIVAYLEEEEINEVVEYIKKEMNSLIDVDYGKLFFETKDFPDTNWLDEWKKYYKPIICNSLIIMPIWFRYENCNIDSLIPVYINPGCSFGTGDHPSTRLCLELLSSIDLTNKSVADVGSGSGILGISSLKLGANSCIFLDIDNATLAEAKENLRFNFDFDKIVDMGNATADTKEIIFVKSDLLENANKVYDVIIANITSDPLIRMADQINSFLKDEGYFVCSGIIDKHKDSVISSYTTKGLVLERELSNDGWNAQLFKKK